MALTDTRPDEATATSGPVEEPPARTQPTAVEKVLGSGDHKTIGRIFIGASLLFLACDLVIAGIVNLSLGSDLGVEASVLHRFDLNSPISLLLCGALPLMLGLAIYLVPLQLGSPSIAFPRLAAASLWTWLGATATFTISLLVKGSYGGSSESLVRLGHLSVGLLALALMAGAISVVVTVVSSRQAGMSIASVPFFSFSWLVTGTLWLVTLPVVLAVVTIWQIQRGPVQSNLEFGAYPRLVWLFGQPAIYIAAIPLLGLFADVCASVSGGRQKNYGLVQGLIVAFGALSFGPWAQSFGARQTLMWVIAAVAIGLPALGVLGAGLDTLRRGKLAVTGGLVLAVSSLLVLLLAAATGAVQGIASLGEGQLFDLAEGGFGGNGAGTSVAVFYFVIGAVVIAGIGATCHWGSRLYRGGLPKLVGLGLAPIALLGAVAFGAGHLIIGVATPDESAAEGLATLSGIGGLVLAAAALGALLAVVAAAFRNSDGHEVVLNGPPESTGGTFEWLATSPPPAGNFDADLPAVESEYPRLDLIEDGAN